MRETRSEACSVPLDVEQRRGAPDSSSIASLISILPSPVRVMISFITRIEIIGVELVDREVRGDRRIGGTEATAGEGEPARTHDAGDLAELRDVRVLVPLVVLVFTIRARRLRLHDQHCFRHDRNVTGVTRNSQSDETAGDGFTVP